MFGRNKFAMLVAEFLGAGVLTLLVLSVQHSAIPISYFIALGVGLGLAALTYALTGVSGAHFNPAITFGLWTARKVKTLPALMYIVVQLLGGYAAYGLYRYFVNTGLQPIGGHFTLRVLVAEAVGTFIFALVWAAAAARRLPAAVGGAGLAVGMMVAGTASYGLLNPAIAVGARAWGGLNGWMGLGTYAAGPLLGAMVAFLVYELLFSAEAVVAAPVVASKPVVAKPLVAKPVAVKPVRASTAKRVSTRKPAAKVSKRK